MSPIGVVVGAAAGAGASLQRRAVDRVLDSNELERVMVVAVNSAHVEAAVRRAMSSDGAVRLVDALLDNGVLDRVVDALFENGTVDRLLDALFGNGVVDRLVDRLFESGAIDRLFERLLASEALWHLIDEIAASPAVTAAISDQGLGFADQVGDEVRTRSRKADDWVERAARRLMHRPARALPAEPDASS